MSDNLKLWDAVSRVPPDHLKSFKKSGGFSGTAIRPMWSIKTMTEQFGPCGQGWGVQEPKFTIHPAGAETLVFCTVGVWFKDNTAPVYGVGGDKVIAQFSSGLKPDDEAFKKAYTDAITNALKMIGVGADIHMGLWDGNKYVDEPPQASNDAPQSPPKQQGENTPLVKEAFTKIDSGLNTISQTGNLEDLKSWWTTHQDTINKLPANYKKSLTEKKDQIKTNLTQKAA